MIAINFGKKFKFLRFQVIVDTLLEGRERFLVVDEVSANTAVDVVWSMHTKASISIASDGKKATLSQGGKTVEALLLSPAGATLLATDVNLQTPQLPTTGIRKLQVKGVKSSFGRVIVLIAPPAFMTPSVTVHPLSEWKTKGSIVK